MWWGCLLTLFLFVTKTGLSKESCPRCLCHSSFQLYSPETYLWISFSFQNDSLSWGSGPRLPNNENSAKGPAIEKFVGFTNDSPCLYSEGTSWKWIQSQFKNANLLPKIKFPMSRNSHNFPYSQLIPKESKGKPNELNQWEPILDIVGKWHTHPSPNASSPATEGSFPLKIFQNTFWPTGWEAKSGDEDWSSIAQIWQDFQKCRAQAGHCHNWTSGSWRCWSTNKEGNGSFH